MQRLAAALRAWTRQTNQPMLAAPRSAAIEKYLAHGRRPWSEGYWEYREQFTAAALGDQALMRQFQLGQDLPAGYGARLDERVVEYPWVMSHLAERRGSLLDAGATLNYRYLLQRTALKKRQIVMCSLTIESEQLSRPGLTYLLADLRFAPFRPANFDNIVCISTLEHIGLDSTQVYGEYGAGEHYREQQPSTFRLAIQEFKRLLAPGGRLYLTVPFGQHQQFGWLQQFDENLLEQVKTAFGGQVADLTFFRYSAAGWQRATLAACQTARYFDIHQETEPAPDHAAAARAVACLALVNTGTAPTRGRVGGTAAPQ